MKVLTVPEYYRQVVKRRFYVAVLGQTFAAWAHPTADKSLNENGCQIHGIKVFTSTIRAPSASKRHEWTEDGDPGHKWRTRKPKTVTRTSKEAQGARRNQREGHKQSARKPRRPPMHPPRTRWPLRRGTQEAGEGTRGLLRGHKNPHWPPMCQALTALDAGHKE
jgi:hypothetical protein